MINNYIIQERLVKLAASFIPFKTRRRRFRQIFQDKINYKKYLHAQNYLKKYNSNEKYPAICTDINPKKLPIWVLWLQGENEAPPLVKQCIKNIKKYNSGREVRVLTNDNIFQYIGLPDFIIDKKRKGIISNTHFSDIIRVCLLEKYGGTWIDATVLLTGEIPEVILMQDFFAFSIPVSSMSYHFHLFSSWFLHVKPEHVFIKNIKNSLFKYWEKEDALVDYFTLHLMAFNIIQGDQLFIDIWENTLNISNEAPHALQKRLNDKFDPVVFEEIKKQSTIHKLTYKINNRKQGSFFDEFCR